MADDGDDSVWANVSPLLEFECKGSFLLALTHFLSLAFHLYLFPKKVVIIYVLLFFFKEYNSRGLFSLRNQRDEVFDWLLRKNGGLSEGMMREIGIYFWFNWELIE